MRHKVFSSVLLASMAIWSVNAELVQIANMPYDDGLGDASSGVYRIPAMAKSTNGVIVAVYDCRYNSSGDLPNVIDLAENWSGDNGATWSSPRVAVDVPNTNNLEKACNIGDPCIVYDPAGDKFWLMGITGGGLASSHKDGVSVADVVLYTRGTGENDTWQEWTGGPAGNMRSVKQMILDSLAEVDPNATNDEDRICGILQGPGHGVVQRQTVFAPDGETVLMPKDAIVFPMQYFSTKRSENTSSWAAYSWAFAVYSTDGGVTWKSTKLAPTQKAQESCVMELDDGSWVMMAKCQSGGERYFFRTTDYLNWTKHDSLSPSAACQGSCLWLGKGADGKSRYVSCFATGSDRSNITLHFGSDNSSYKDSLGIIWDSSLKSVIHEGSVGGAYAYNSLIMVDEHTLGILLETFGHIIFCTEDVSEVLAKEIRFEVPDPVAEWNGDFSAGALTNFTSSGYTLVDWNETHGKYYSSVTIDRTNQGLMFNSDTAMPGLTVLVRYSGLEASESAKRVLFASCVTSNHKYDRTGVQLNPNGTLVGLWNNHTSSCNDADNGDASGSIPSSGVMALTYSTAGTYLYYGASSSKISSTATWGSSALKSSNDTSIYGAAIGGMCADSTKSSTEAAKGMTINAVAVFDCVLTAEQMRAYKWPAAPDGSLVVEINDSTVKISNTNATSNKASWSPSATPTVSIPLLAHDDLTEGTYIKLDSLGIGFVDDMQGVTHPKMIAISSGTRSWVSSLVTTNNVDVLVSKDSAVYPRLVYSFADANCVLTVGETYSVSLLDASGAPMSGKIRHALSYRAQSIFSGLDFSADYTPMFQLTGEIVSEDDLGFVDPCFDWTPGSAPTGSWFTAWKGENGGSPKTVVGPNGTAQSIQVTYRNGNNDTWTPYCSDAAHHLTNFTFITYGSADMVTADSGKYAVLWCMGQKDNAKTALVKDSDGNICLVQITGAEVAPARTITAGPVKGYHVFTVRFNQVGGASLQIDDGQIMADSNFTTVAHAGFQVGSVRGGCNGPLEVGSGFAVLKMLAFPTNEIPEEQYAALCAQYPSVTAMSALEYNVAGGSLYMPSLTLSSGQLRIKSGTLEVPAGVEASLSALEFGDKEGNPSFGMNLAGKITINTASTGSDNNFNSAYSDCNNGRGVDLGEWTGTGTHNISGSFIASNTIVEVCHDSSSVTTTIDGGELVVKGITAKNANRASLVLTGGGTLNLGQYPSCNVAIGKTYGLGTVTGTASWTDTDAIVFNETISYTTILADGIDLAFTGTTTGGGNVGIRAPNGGSVKFTDYQGTGAIGALEGTLRLKVVDGATLPCRVAVAGGATLDVLTDDPNALAVTFAASSLYMEDGATVTLNGKPATYESNGATLSLYGITTMVVEVDGDSLKISNTNVTPDVAVIALSSTPTLSIPHALDDALRAGTRIALTSLDFGSSPNASYTHANRIAISWNGETWYSSAVEMDSVSNPFPYKNSTTVPRAKYSFAGSGCILVVGETYTVSFFDENGAAMSNVRYTQAKAADTLFSGMGLTGADGAKYTTMFQLNGEIVEDDGTRFKYFDWIPGSAPKGWFTSWAGENGGPSRPVIGPDGLSTNMYVTYYDGDGNTEKWLPYQDNPSPSALSNYTFLVYGSADDVCVSSDKMAVLWCMGYKTQNKTALVKDDAGNICLVQVSGTGETPDLRINAGPVEGFHLFAVRFDESGVVSLQIDGGEVHSSDDMATVSGFGLQVGSVLGGVVGPFERGYGFVVARMFAYTDSEVSARQYAALCAEFPAVTNRVLVTMGGVNYYRLKYAMDDIGLAKSFAISSDTTVDIVNQTMISEISGEMISFEDYGIVVSDNNDGTYSVSCNIADECVLRISEIMPKPTDALNRGKLEGMDVNGLESGWVEVENTSDKWADLADYRFIRVNRGKKTDPAGVGNFPSRLVPPNGRAIFYTSERYSNSKDKTVSAFEHGTFDGKPMVMGADLHNILVWGDKVNPKKSPYVRLYYAPGGDSDGGTVVDTVVIPSDLPEGWSIIVGDAAEGEGTRRWLCPTPTRGRANTSTDGLKRIGPNVGPLYEKKGQKKTDLANEFAVPTPPAIPGEVYVVTLPVNGVMNPNGTFTPRNDDQIQSLKLVFRKDLDDSTLVTNDIDMAAKETVENWGDLYTTTIPASYFPAAGHLMQWKVLITDGEGVEWTSPSFNNPDDGYEWYGTIVEAPELESATLPTWHMFVDEASRAQMDYDKDDSRYTLPNGARVAIYDSSTSNYYDYVRIDLRGHTSAGFTKKGHGLRFAKAHPLTMTDIVTGETIEEIRKTSLISEFADPSYMRQMIAFWLWRKMGNLVPFDFPVRCNMNGEFYQLAFNSERFTDELIEDVYGLDKYGYGYKNVGTLKSGSSTTAGGIEKKTPDDENESDITVLQNELRSKIIAAQQVSSSPDGGSAGLDNAALTKFVVEKFELPAWLNYLASARITHEMDDVWANVCAYYDNPEMKDGVRGKGTWMPLGYDFNLSFGQWYYNDIGGTPFGLTSTNDWYKSHPFYGGNRVRCYASSAMTSKVNNGNDGFESVLQSAKFRRLFLRRLRTLMDQQLKEPGTAEDDTPFMAKMREMADLMRADAERDQIKWPNNGTDNAIDVWTTRPADMDAGIQDIWDNYVVPRREHLYVTHSVTNTAKEVGYGSNLNAGIPEAQSPVETLAPNISISNLTPLDAAEAEALGVAGQLYDTEVVVIRNDNDEVVDMSGWRLAFSVDFTFPAGTVCDANDSIYIVADRRAYIDAHDAELTDQVIVGNATFTGAGPVALYDADGALVYSAIPQTDELKYLRLHSFYGNTLDGDGDAGEWFTLTNISDAVTLDLTGVTVCFLKQGDPEEGTAHCHVTLENKKGKGSIAPLKSWTAQQADYSDKGWEKIQNNKQQITIYDKYGSVCQSLKVTQKNFPLACGKGGYLVCDSADASVTSDSQWHESLYELPNNGELSEPFAANSQEAANELIANAKPALSDDDVAAGLETQYLKIVALPVEGEVGKYKAVVVVNPDTVEVPVMAQIEEGEATVDPLTVESDEEGSKVTVGVSNATVGLWYGFIWTDSLGDKPFENDVESFKRATSASVKIESKAEAAKNAQKAFFRVKVSATKP